MAKESVVARESSANPINAVSNGGARRGGGVLSDSSVKLKMSDLRFTSRDDDETNEELASRGVDTRLTRWDVPNVAYRANGRDKSAYATITQFLESPRGGIGGYEAYFDKPGPIGEAKTLNDAKKILLRRINSLRG